MIKVDGISKFLNFKKQMSKKQSEVRQLQDKLNSPELDMKLQAIRRIIDAMTRGKDVSMLFMDVLKNIETSSLQLKKLIFLYIMSYAKTHPDLAILGVSSFRKNAVDKSNPFLRALAVRTMGCIRIKEITEYLCDPLKKAMKDEDPYVRKTGALCVPKLLEIAPELVQEQGFLTLLENMLNDGNATVVSNAIASLSICSEIKGYPIFQVTGKLAQKLLTAMNDCNEWGVVYILDQLACYLPKDPNQAEGIMERVSSRLAHTNAAVSLSAIRLIVRFMDYLSNPETLRTYNNKISSPLVSMISREPQISYIVLKTMNLILQKRPLLLPKELKVFFVNYHDPLYVKLEKLQILVKIANNQNILMILHQLKQCVQEVDVEFVRKAVRTMGRCAIKLDKMADKCVQCLWETLKTKVPYVVQEAVIVIRDIFRKYPNKYEGLLADICENLKCLDDPQAKASIVWIIGEYVDMIENSDQLMLSFADNFKDQADVVQQQILISTMKLYLHKPSEGQEILKDLFKYITKESENPDLRDRGYLYWRLLSTSPKIAKEVVLAERPPISQQSYAMDTEILDSLIANLTTLSAIYCKQPEEFVKKLKDNANAREVIEADAEGLLDHNPVEQNPVEQHNENVTFANNNQGLVENVAVTNNQEGLIDISNTENNKERSKGSEGPVETNLMDVEPVQTRNQNNLMDLNLDSGSQAKHYGTMNLSQNNQNLGGFATQANNSENIFNLEEKQDENQFKNIIIPLVEVISFDHHSMQKKNTNLSVMAAFQRQNNKVFMQMHLENQSSQVLQDFALRLKANFLKLAPVSQQLDNLKKLNPQQTCEVFIELNDSNGFGDIEGWPYAIDCALKVNEDIFVFKVPCSLGVGFSPNFCLSTQAYKQIVSSPDSVKKHQVLPNKLPLNEFITRMQQNNMYLTFRRENGSKQLMSFGCSLMGNDWVLVVDIIFDRGDNSISVQTTGPNQGILQYFNHAIAMIVNL